MSIPEDTRKRAIQRLKIACGHLDSIVTMLKQDDPYCMNILRELKTVHGGISGASEVVLRGHLESHIATGLTRNDTEELINELMCTLKCI